MRDQPAPLCYKNWFNYKILGIIYANEINKLYKFFIFRFEENFSDMDVDIVGVGYHGY